MPKIIAGTNPRVSDRERRNMDRVRRAAAEGMVLLENNGVLPISAEVKSIALFGAGARRTIKGGTGSGDVNSRSVVSVEQGLLDAGFTVTTSGYLSRYDEKVESARLAYVEKLKAAAEKNEGGSLWLAFFNDPFAAPDIDVPTAEEIEATRADAAVYVLARNSGEGKDRVPGEGSYDLTEAEKASIQTLAEAYGNLIVALNVGGVIDTKFLRAQKGVGALLLMSQAGSVGGWALADVLTGKSVPSGHLTTTWAENYSDYPNAENFSHMNGDLDDEYYTEGIYVGYRYFDTFNVRPAYPFGYGLGYTDFSCRAERVTLEGGLLQVRASVTNIGKYHPGQEVAQVYVSAPRGRLSKPCQELRGYAKTKLLPPGGQETLSITVPVSSLASYEEERAAWVLEAGEYVVRLGVHSRKTSVVAVLTVPQEIITEKTVNLLQPDSPLTELTPLATPWRSPSELSEIAAAPRITLDVQAIATRTVSYSTPMADLPRAKVDRTLTAADVLAGRATLDELVSQLSVEEMAELCVGTGRGGISGSAPVGAASTAVPGAAGDTSSRMIGDRDIRNMVLADGPAGLRLLKSFQTDRDGMVIPGKSAPLPGFDDLMLGDEPEVPRDAITHYQYCTAIPIATLLAQTWNLQLIEEMGDLVGGEMEEFGVTLWLAPGMNIHRNPLCGRNFEYYSEDPLVSGLSAAADTRGVQKHAGCGTTIKHFACNNQEDNRMHVNVHVGERALREIYLKGFEIAVRTAQPLSIMTSYNLINGTHAANSRELLTAIARDEWGFEGLVMTDWGTTGSLLQAGEKLKYGNSHAAGCVKAGNDLTMPGSQRDVDEIVRAVGAEEGSVPYPLTMGELQSCARHILAVLLRSSAYRLKENVAASSYRTYTRLTDWGPYVTKLILSLPCEVGENDVDENTFNVYVERRDKDGSVLMCKAWGEDMAHPSKGYQDVVRAYPCGESGDRVTRGRFAALELREEDLGKRTEGSVLSSRYIDNCYRVTQLKPLPAAGDNSAKTVGLVFDTCAGDLCPELAGWSNGRYGENSLRFGYFTPANPTGKKLPLVVWLHGAGEGGDNPVVAYTGNRVTALSSPLLQRKLGGAAWVLVPQCPTVWMDDGEERLGRSNRSIYVEPLKACIDRFIQEHAETIDAGRIYVTGISNGGFMTMRMLVDYPGFFAAAAPGCQAFFDSNMTDGMLESIKGTPIWLIHAKRDEMVDPRETSLPIYHRLLAAGAKNVHMTYWDEVLDPTGEYRDQMGRPRAYFNHGVWILMLDDACRVDLDGCRVMQDGEPVTLWEWMGKQHK